MGGSGPKFKQRAWHIELSNKQLVKGSSSEPGVGII